VWFVPKLGTNLWTKTMPVYDFKCTACGAREEHILLSGETPPSACVACGGDLKRAWSGRLHVSLEGWGFSKTDSLLPEDRPRKPWKMLKERAERIADE
jgi:putative FmdB family regulatory protein